jgi:hypothetical protein
MKGVTGHVSWLSSPVCSGNTNQTPSVSVQRRDDFCFSQTSIRRRPRGGSPTREDEDETLPVETSDATHRYRRLRIDMGNEKEAGTSITCSYPVCVNARRPSNGCGGDGGRWAEETFAALAAVSSWGRQCDATGDSCTAGAPMSDDGVVDSIPIASIAALAGPQGIDWPRCAGPILLRDDLKIVSPSRGDAASAAPSTTTTALPFLSPHGFLVTMFLCCGDTGQLRSLYEQCSSVSPSPALPPMRGFVTRKKFFMGVAMYCSAACSFSDAVDIVMGAVASTFLERFQLYRAVGRQSPCLTTATCPSSSVTVSTATHAPQSSNEGGSRCLAEVFHSFAFDVLGAVEQQFRLPALRLDLLLSFQDVIVTRRADNDGAAVPPPSLPPPMPSLPSQPDDARRGFSMKYRQVSATNALRVLQLTLGSCSSLVAHLVHFLQGRAAATTCTSQRSVSPATSSPVSQDLWFMVFVLCSSGFEFPQFEGYSDLYGWPLLLDEFVDWSRRGCGV